MLDSLIRDMKQCINKYKKAVNIAEWKTFAFSGKSYLKKD